MICAKPRFGRNAQEGPASPLRSGCPPGPNIRLSLQTLALSRGFCQVRCGPRKHTDTALKSRASSQSASVNFAKSPKCSRLSGSRPARRAAGFRSDWIEKMSGRPPRLSHLFSPIGENKCQAERRGFSRGADIEAGGSGKKSGAGIDNGSNLANLANYDRREHARGENNALEVGASRCFRGRCCPLCEWRAEGSLGSDFTGSG